MNKVTLPQLESTISALGHLERSMFHLHANKAKYHPQMYAVMAEPTVEEILKLRAQIDAAIGLTEFAAPGYLLSAEPPTTSNDDAQHPEPAQPAAVG